MISETTRANRWLRTMLVSDPTLAGIVGPRVYRGVAPQGAAVPFVSFSLLAAPASVMGNGPVVVWQKLVYLVKGVTKGSSVDALQLVSDRIATVLHAQRGATGDAAIDYCVRLRPFDMETIEGAEKWQHLGHELELAVRAVEA